MPGFCTSEPYGFTDLSTNITMFDQSLSKALVVIKDFRVSEMSMDGNNSSGESSSTEVDPADITSVIRWNYSLDVMTPDDISQVVSRLPPQDRLFEVFKSQISLSSHVLSDRSADIVIDIQDGASQVSWSQCP